MTLLLVLVAVVIGWVFIAALLSTADDPRWPTAGEPPSHVRTAKRPPFYDQDAEQETGT
jgi:hypothetical protein